MALVYGVVYALLFLFSLHLQYELQAARPYMLSLTLCTLYDTQNVHAPRLIIDRCCAAATLHVSDDFL